MTLKEFREKLVKETESLLHHNYEVFELYAEFNNQAEREGKCKYSSTNNYIVNLGWEFSTSRLSILNAIRKLCDEADKEEEEENNQ